MIVALAVVACFFALLASLHRVYSALRPKSDEREYGMLMSADEDAAWKRIASVDDEDKA